jgi:putative flippase GtrA
MGRVSLLRRLYAQWHRLIHEFTKFGIIGVINTVLDLGLANVFHVGLGMGPMTSKALATVVAATSSYFMNRHWTFRHRARTGLRREYGLFFLLNGIGLAIAEAFIGFTRYVLGYDGVLAFNIAQFAGLVVGTVFRFWSYRRWVFLHPEDHLYATDADVGSDLPGPEGMEDAPARA